MIAEQILELVTIIGGLITLVILTFLGLKYVLPWIREEEKDETAREFVKLRTELRLKKKYIKVLEQELKYYETNYPEFATEDEWNNYLSNEIEATQKRVDKLEEKVQEEEDVEEILGKD